jgi:MFS transporter, DHA1 family, multidrug resistance protein
MIRAFIGERLLSLRSLRRKAAGGAGWGIWFRRFGVIEAPVSKPLPSRGEMIAVLGLLSSLGPMGVDMYLPSLPTLARVFSATPGQVQWTLTSFLLGFSLGQSIIGPLADRFGRRKPVLFGVLLFALSSAACPFATSIYHLVGLRFLQALGSCSGIVTARAIARDVFTPAETRRVFATLVLFIAALPLLAPLVGGYLLTAFGWQSSFVVMAVLATITLGLTLWRVPETLRPEYILPLSFRRVADVYALLFRDRLFVLTSIANGVAMAGMFAYIAGSPFVFINLYGVPAGSFGYYFGMNVIGMVSGSQIAGRVLHNTNPRTVLQVCTTFQVLAGIALIAAAYTGFGGIFGIAPALFVYMFCIGVLMPTASAMALANHPEIAGSASALYGTLQFVFAFFSTGALSMIGDGSAMPMAMVIAGCGLIAFISSRLLPALAPAAAR